MTRRRREQLEKDKDKENIPPDIPTRRLQLKHHRTNGRPVVTHLKRKLAERSTSNALNQVTVNENKSHSASTENSVHDLRSFTQAIKSRWPGRLTPALDSETRRRSDEHIKTNETVSAQNPPFETRLSRQALDKRNQFQVVLTELKAKVLRSFKDSDESNDDGDSQTSPEVNRSDHGTHIASNTPLSSINSQSPVTVTPVSLGNWLTKTKLQRQQGDAHSRRNPFKGDSTNRTGISLFGSRTQLFSNPCTNFDEQDRTSHTTEDKGAPSRIWVPRSRKHKRAVNGFMRRSRSWDTLHPHGDSKVSRNGEEMKQITAESNQLISVNEIRTTLEQAEQKMERYMEDSEKLHEEIRQDISRLQDLYASLSKAQELRYLSVLEVFHENYKILGYVESNFDYVMEIVTRGRTSSLQKLLNRTLTCFGDHGMAVLFQMIHAVSWLYLLVFPKRRYGM